MTAEAETLEPPALADRRAAATAALDVAEREAGAQLLDGGAPDGLALLAAHGTLAILDAAESEAVARERSAEAARQAAARRKAAKLATRQLEALSAAVADAETHSAALRASLATIIAKSAELRASALTLGRRPPSVLDTLTLNKRLSHAVGEALSGLERPRAYGYFSWPSYPTPMTFGAFFDPVAAEMQTIIESVVPRLKGTN